MKVFAKVALLLILAQFSSSQVTSTGCGTTKGCFQNPTGCSPTDAACRFVSWTYDSTAKEFTFELSGAATGKYVAIAFTSTNTMADGDAYICAGGSQFKTAPIIGKTEPVDDAILPTGVSLVSNQDNSGIVQCTFKRPASVTRTISSNSLNFDLETTPYRLLLSAGPTDIATGNSIMAFHSDLYVKSANLIDFKNNGGSNLAAAHTCLLAIIATVHLLMWS